MSTLDRDNLAVDLSRALGVRVTLLGDGSEFHNVHFRATTSAGTRLFVKVLDDAAYWRRAIAAASAVAPLMAGTPQLLEHGELGAGRWWLAYEWLADLAPFEPTPRTLKQVGALLGRLHAATRGATQGFTCHDVDVEITERAGHLAAMDDAAADRVLALQTRWGPTELPGEIGLIHGDFHWRNVGLAAGVPVVFDLENVQAAHPLVDFGKLLDLDGLPRDANREAFFRGYDREADPVLPWDVALRAVQLWTTTGVLVYSLTRGLTDFAAHGYRRLAELELRPQA